MKSISYIVTVLVLSLTVFSFSASAQKRKPSTSSVPSVTQPSQSSLELKSGAENTASEIKKVARFIYVLGGIAQGIEDIDQQAKAGKVSKPTIDQNEQFKQNVIQSIHNLGAGLATLEVEFRTKPGLRPYVSKVDGITAKAGAAEDLAGEGRFKDAGKELLGLIEQLTDALASLP